MRNFQCLIRLISAQMRVAGQLEGCNLCWNVTLRMTPCQLEISVAQDLVTKFIFQGDVLMVDAIENVYARVLATFTFQLPMLTDLVVHIKGVDCLDEPDAVANIQARCQMAAHD